MSGSRMPETCAAVLGGRKRWSLVEQDSMEFLKLLPDACIDAVVTDPPAGIGFMGKEWDEFGKEQQHYGISRSGAGLPRYGTYKPSATPSAIAGMLKVRDAFVAFMQDVMQECHRVLKPGGHALVWAIPRTSHWTATAIENVGFEIRDVVTALTGQGFPKALDVCKAIDRMGGESAAAQAWQLKANREAHKLSREQLAEIVGCTPASIRDWEEGRARAAGKPVEWIIPSPEYRCKLAAALGYSNDERQEIAVVDDRREDGTVMALGHSGVLRTGGHTELAARWQGFGTALKPASEHWILARKPLVGTVAENVIQHGTGALNIDGCRITTTDNLNGGAYSGEKRKRDGYSATDETADAALSRLRRGIGDYKQPAGRWPANTVLVHAEGCCCVGTKKVKGDARRGGEGDRPGGFVSVGSGRGSAKPNGQLYGDEDGTETVEAWECVEGCPVVELDRQSGVRKSGARSTKVVRGSENKRALYNKGWNGDGTPVYPADVPASEGGASRFFYCAKPSKAERTAGVPGGELHPTVKSITLMRYLCRLVTPPNGLVLDPFAGSGTTGCAALLEGFRFIGIEREPEYVKIATARIAHWDGKAHE